MKSKELLRAIGEIDDQFIEEADMPSPVRIRRRVNLRKVSGLAACIVVLLIAGILATTGTLRLGRGSAAPDNNSFARNDSMPMPAASYNTADAAAPQEDAFYSDKATVQEASAGSETITSGAFSVPEKHVAEAFEFIEDLPRTGYPGAIWDEWISGHQPEERGR